MLSELGRTPRCVLLFDFDGTLADTMPHLIDGLIVSFGVAVGGELTRTQIMGLLHLKQDKWCENSWN